MGSLRSFRISAVTLIAIALLATACGGLAAGRTIGSPSQVTLKLTEMKFDPSTITVEAGTPVTITVKNEGTVTHNFIVKGMEKETDLDVDPGKSASTTVTFPKAGTYEFICDEEGHEAAGMKGQILVR